MGKPDNNGMGSEEAADEDEKAQAVDISSEKAERKGQAGAATILGPAPAPRKRGRPRKVVPKVEESISPELQQSMTDAESKKLKGEASSAPARNGTAAAVKLNARALPHPLPLRREGSRRKSEPRRAAD